MRAQEQLNIIKKTLRDTYKPFFLKTDPSLHKNLHEQNKGRSCAFLREIPIDEPQYKQTTGCKILNKL